MVKVLCFSSFPARLTTIHKRNAGLTHLSEGEGEQRINLIHSEMEEYDGKKEGPCH